MLRSFHWDWEHEKCVEKLWPMGPVCALGNGRIWPVLFLYKKGYYLVRSGAAGERVWRSGCSAPSALEPDPELAKCSKFRAWMQRGPPESPRWQLCIPKELQVWTTVGLEVRG